MAIVFEHRDAKSDVLGLGESADRSRRCTSDRPPQRVVAMLESDDLPLYPEPDRSQDAKRSDARRFYMHRADVQEFGDQRGKRVRPQMPTGMRRRRKLRALRSISRRLRMCATIATSATTAVRIFRAHCSDGNRMRRTE